MISIGPARTAYLSNLSFDRGAASTPGPRVDLSISQSGLSKLPPAFHLSPLTSPFLMTHRRLAEIEDRANRCCTSLDHAPVPASRTIARCKILGDTRVELSATKISPKEQFYLNVVLEVATSVRR